MSLGVLTVDVDKLIAKRVRIPSAESRLSTVQRLTSPSVSRDDAQNSAKKRVPTPSSDCYLLKQYDRRKIWGGVVTEELVARSPRSPSSSVSKSKDSSLKKKSKKLPQRDDVSPNTTEDRPSPSCSPSSLSPHKGGGNDPCVRVLWNPSTCYGHTQLLQLHTVPRDDEDNGEVESVRGRSPVSATLRGNSRGESCSDASNSRPGTTGSRVGSGRLGSARMVRLVGIDEPPPPPPPLPTTTTPQGNTVTGEVNMSSSAANRPPIPRPTPQPPAPTPSSKLPGGVSTSSSLSTPPPPPPVLSVAAQHVIDSALEFVHHRMQHFVEGPFSNGRGRVFSNAHVEQRVLSPRRESVADTLGNPTDSRRRVPGAEMIKMSAQVSPRQESLTREKQRLLALNCFQQECLSSPKCKAHPSTQSSYRRSIHSKSDAMFPSVFQLEYVKPPRCHFASNTSVRHEQAAHGAVGPALSQQEKTILAALDIPTGF